MCVAEEVGSGEKDLTNKENQILLLSFSWSDTFCELEYFVAYIPLHALIKCEIGRAFSGRSPSGHLISACGCFL